MNSRLFSCFLPCFELWSANNTTADDKDWTWVDVAAVNPSAVQCMLQKLDGDGEGRVYLQRPIAVAELEDVMAEIKGIMAEASLDENWLDCVEDLLDAFEFYDRDGDGVISAEDLGGALKDVVVGVEESDRRRWAAECKEMVRAFDRENLGGVSFDDFVLMLTSNV